MRLIVSMECLPYRAEQGRCLEIKTNNWNKNNEYDVADGKDDDNSELANAVSIFYFRKT